MCLSLQGQAGHYNSPYSFFAFGDLQNAQFANQIGSGHLGIATRSPSNVSVRNPASYTALALTTFDFGLHSKSITISDLNQSQTVSGTGFSNLNLSINIAPWWGASTGLFPYSQVNYQLSDQGTHPQFGEEIIYTTGKGSIYQYYLGNAFRYKNLSAGFNISYIFGNVSHSLYGEYPELEATTTNYFNSYLLERSTYGGLNLDWGVQYAIKLKEKSALTFGATLATGQGVGYEEEREWSRTNGTFPVLFSSIDSTTVFGNNYEEGSIELPTRYGLGVHLISDKLQLGTEVEFSNWSGAKLNRLEAAELTNRTKFAIGGWYQAQTFGAASFWGRIQYRLGFYYDTYYIKIADKRTPQYGITFGAGLPLSRKDPYSRLNFSVDLGQKGSIEDNLIKESYAKLNFGFTFNDPRWFVKRKYD